MCVRGECVEGVVCLCVCLCEVCVCPVCTACLFCLPVYPCFCTCPSVIVLHVRVSVSL